MNGAALVLEVQPDFYEEFDNRPGFKVRVGEMPALEDHRYATDGEGHYLSLYDDVASFFYYKNGPREGFGGWNRDVILIDGTKVNMTGGWSSNAQTINAAFPDHPAITEASITDKKEVMKLGYTFMSGAVTVESILRWWLDNETKIDWSLNLMSNGQVSWIEPGKNRFIKPGAHVLHRLLPARKIYEKDRDAYKKRMAEWFWKAWAKAPHGGRDELSSDQMEAVEA